MPIVEKPPQSTILVSAGWTNPTDALRFDGNYTYAETDNAEQEYYGYAMGLSGGERIDKVFARIKYITKVTTVLTGDTLTYVCYLKVFNGSTWQTYQIEAVDFAVTTGNDEDLTSTHGESTDNILALDVTAFLNTVAKINSAKIRLLLDITATAAGCTARWSVDCVSLLVVYGASAAVMVTAPRRPSLEAEKSLVAVKKYLQLIGG